MLEHPPRCARIAVDERGLPATTVGYRLVVDFKAITSVGTRGFDVATALKFPRWAWHVRVTGNERLDELTKVNVTWLTLDKWSQPTLPDVIAKLPRLARLEVRGASKLRRLPDFIFKMKQLEVLDLAGCAIESLDGVERMPSLAAMMLDRTPIGRAKSLRELVARIPDASLSHAAPGLVQIERPAVRPKNRAELIAAIQRGVHPDLPKLDASGGTFEGLDLYWGSQKTNFSKTRWHSCHLHGDLRGANFDGATFEQCMFSDRWFDGVSAKGAIFRDCYFKQCVMQRATLDGATLDIATDSELDLTSARAAKMRLTAMFSSPDAAKKLVAPKADLRDATVQVSLAPGAKKPKGTWPTNTFPGARTSKATRIEYAPLDGAIPITPSTAAPTRRAAPKLVDPKGPTAAVLGRIDASNTGLWVLVADAKAAAAWRGDDGEKISDFSRAEQALASGKLTLPVGDARGVIVSDIGEHGYAYAYKLDHGVALLELGVPEEDVDESIGWKKLSKLHGAHAVQLAAKRSVKLGKISVTSGALALLLPYATLRARGEDQLVLPLANGTYEVVKEQFADPPPSDAYGAYVGRVRIARV